MTTRGSAKTRARGFVAGWNNLTLNWKLMVSFAMLVLLIAVAGGSGLLFVTQIGGSVETIAAVSGPLVTKTSETLKSTEHAVTALGEAVEEPTADTIAAAEKVIGAETAAIAANLDDLKKSAAEAGLPLDLSGAETAGKAFGDSAKRAIQSLRSVVEADDVAARKLEEFDGLAEEINKVASDIANESETLMSEREDSSRMLIQSGSALVSDLESLLSDTLSNTYPLLRNAYRLQTFVVAMQDTEGTYLATDDAAEMESLKAEFVRLLRSANERQEQLLARSTGGVRESVSQIGAKLQAAEQAVLAEGGLFEAHARTVAAGAEAEAARKEMQTAFAQFDAVLGQVFTTVSRLNESSVNDARDSVSTTMMSTLAVIVFGVLAAIGSGLFVAGSVAKPLVAMTGVMARLAAGDEEAQIPGLDRRDEVGAMAQSLSTIRDTGVRAARIQTALDNASSVTLMTDLEGRVNYANRAARAWFAEIEAEVRTLLPEFNAKAVEETDVAALFGNAAAARNRIADLRETYAERVRIGGRTVDVTMNPVVGEAGNRLGTVVEWADVTEQLKAEAEKAERLAMERAREEERRKMELSFQSDMAAFVEAAAAGDLSRRVNLDGRSGLMLQLGEGMNRWADAVAKALGEVVEIMAAMAEGDLSKRISGDYKGELLRLKADTNATADKLAAIVGQTVEGMATIKSATEQLTAGAKDLSTRTEEQVAGLEEMAASIRQMSVTVKQNAENAQKANDLALTARSSAESGGEVAKAAVAAVGQIEESAQKIADIVGMMDEIAFQTNLLALNAAVEAARAGDAGRGFAVVAEEVRALAQRSSQASKEIKGLINTSGNQVKRGVDLVNKAGTSLGEIVASVKKVAEIVSEIAAASREQSEGVQQVDTTVSQMEAVTQKNASLVEESTASLNSVDGQVDGLMNVVSFFNTGRPAVRDLHAGLAKRIGAVRDPAPAGRTATDRHATPPRGIAPAANWKGF